MFKRLRPVFLLFALACLLAVGQTAEAGQKKGLTKEIVEKSLGPQIPGLSVISIKEAGIGGLWEVVVDTPKGKGILYMDEKADKMVVGNIFDLSTKRNLTQEKYDEINRVPFSSIPLKDAIVMGSETAKYKVAVFDDPD